MAKKKAEKPTDEDEAKQEDVKPVQVTEEEKLAFFKAFISDAPFTLEDSLFNGAVKVVFRSLTASENMDIFDQIRKEQVKGLLTNDANYLTDITCYRLALSMQSINGEAFQANITKKDFPAPAYAENPEDTYISKKAQVVKDWPVFKLSAFAEAFKAFEDKLIYLTKEVQSENFWPADR